MVPILISHPFSVVSDQSLIGWGRAGARGNLIGEIRVGMPHIDEGAANKAFEHIANAVLQDAVGGQPNNVFDSFAFEILVRFWAADAGVGAQLDA